MYEGSSVTFWIVIASFVMPLFLSAILIWLLLTYQKKKHQAETAAKDAQLREQALIIEKQTALEAERTRISSEMHDDLGSGLTRIQYLAEKAMRFAPEEEKAEISKIASYSNELVRNMGEIIWAMNSRFDNIESLAAYIRRYASEYLEAYDIPFTFKELKSESNPALSAEKRRAIFLVVKELLHNAIKYSGCTSIQIELSAHPKPTLIFTEFNAKGFDPVPDIQQGNGIFNMQKRIHAINGQIYHSRDNQNMVTTISW